MTDASSAHPAFNRPLSGGDLAACTEGTVVVDCYGIRWEKAEPTWVSIIESNPGLAGVTLVRLAGPIRLVRDTPDPNPGASNE